jgi:SMODS and SLOG-associating 2TM effector domain 3/SMODS and SLOG-associating 2TM effector domain 1
MNMEDKDFPALYRSANELSLDSQTYFFRALKLHLLMLVVAAILSVVSIPHWSIAVLQLLALLAALFCSIYLFAKRPDRHWYSGRAVAESIKTITWRYVCRAEPFQSDDAIARSYFLQRLKAIVDQNKDVVEAQTNHLDARQLTDVMVDMRKRSLEARKTIYADSRIKNQLTWYAKKAALNKNTSNIFFWVLIATNGVAVLCAILRIVFVEVPFWPTDIFVAVAASLLSWMQAKRFSELAASYALAAREIGLIREQSLLPSTEEEFSLFVGDAENAFSREHTQWVARKDN